jgi:hypothetical protein
MPIHIRKVESDYTVIPNSLAQTKDFSPDALGILVRLLSMPNNSGPDKLHPKDDHGMGIDRLDRIFNELQEYHYLYPERRRHKSGQHVTTVWHVSNVPLSADRFGLLTKGADPDRLEDIGEIWEVWNDEDYTKHEQWNCQETQSVELVKAITENLETYDCHDIVVAIENYAKVRLSDECDCQDSMDLLEFLTFEDTDTNERRWHQFLEIWFEPGRYHKAAQSSGASST